MSQCIQRVEVLVNGRRHLSTGAGTGALAFAVPNIGATARIQEGTDYFGVNFCWPATEAVKDIPRWRSSAGVAEVFGIWNTSFNPFGRAGTIGM